MSACFLLAIHFSGRDNKQNVKECVQENSVACDADSQQNAEDLLPHLVDYLEPYCKKGKHKHDKDSPS